jgi:hypothetical protein
MRYLSLGVMFLVGCSVDQESFPKQSANIVCPQMKKCNLGYFDSVYGDMKTCKTEMAIFSEDLIYFMESGLSCDYDPDEAGSCLREFSKMSCDELHEVAGIEDVCSGVFTGCIEE